MTEYRFLSLEKQQNLMRSRFGISHLKHHQELDDELTILPCENLYEALSYAITGTVRYEEEFRLEILYFIQNSWINPTILEAFEKKLRQSNKEQSIESYVEEQLTNFNSSPSPPFLEIKAAATFLQVTIHMFVPGESKDEPKYIFRPIVDNLKKKSNDSLKFDPKDTILISAEQIVGDRYEYGAVVSFPYNIHSKARQRSHATSRINVMFENLKNFFVKNTTQSNVENICENIGYPKLKYFGKRRIGVAHDDILNQVFSEWYTVADVFCRQVSVKPSTLLARSYWLNGEQDLSKKIEPSYNHQRINKDAHLLDKVCQTIRKRFLEYVRPM